MISTARRDPDPRGYFGEFGGRYVPETLVEPVEALERAYLTARDDRGFCDELDRLLKDYVGRATPLYEAKRLSAAAGGARIFLKRACRSSSRLDVSPTRSSRVSAAAAMRWASSTPSSPISRSG